MKISTLPVVIFFLIYMYTYIFIFGCAGSLLLLGLFSSCDEQGPLFSCAACASHCSGFSCCRARALKHLGFSSCDSQTQWPRGMLSLSGPGIEPVSPVLAGRFLTTGPPGKSLSAS